MRYPAFAKAEIIALVEQSPSACQTHAREARHPASRILSVVRSLPCGWR